MVDKNFCMSSFLTFRYIEDRNKEFAEGLKHKNLDLTPDENKIYVKDVKDIDTALTNEFDKLKKKYKHLGIMLSGGMDSGILASYMKGADAYTFRFLGGEFQQEELKRAEYYSKYYGLTLHYVDINWNDTVEKHIDKILDAKNAPVHSIEPQLYQAGLQAKKDGVDLMIIGDGADFVFGGLDGLLAKDWSYDEFKKRYTFVDPQETLVNPCDMDYLFKRYRQENNKIDYIKFVNEIFGEESYMSYKNAFDTANIAYYDPYAKLKMAEKLDLKRIRNGESKYLVRELMKIKYPDIPVPNKVPMPRPVDFYFKDWKGPMRPEFRKDIDMSKLTGNQKWLLWCLERFLNNIENKK